MQLQYLKPSLPLKDQPKVSAVKTIEECWKRLGKVYGDKTVNVITVKSNLRNLSLKGTQRWEKVLQLFDEVEKAEDQLEVIGAKDEISNDYELISCLINKLHCSYQEEWDGFLCENKRSYVEKNLWEKFIAFLTKKNSVATESKMRCMWDMAPSDSSQEKKGKDSKFAKRNTVYSNLTLAEISTRTELDEYCKEHLRNNRPCQVCDEQHHFQKSFTFGKGLVPTRRLSTCPEFEERTPDERGDLVRELNACYSCLDTNHQGNECRWRDQNKCAECGEPHHTLLHGSGEDWGN